MSDTAHSRAQTWGKNVLVEFDNGIAFVQVNRPHRKNAISIELAREMNEVWDRLEVDERCGVVVLTGVGDSFLAGMDLKEFFRAAEKLSPPERLRAYRLNAMWMWRKLINFAKPTIAMANGWCFGGGLVPLVACDLAIAADEAQFGVSEINWAIVPAGNVSKALSSLMNQRQALYYIMTGEAFGGKKAAELGLVNESVPLDRLRARTTELARVLLAKNPFVLRAAKTAFKQMVEMSWDQAAEYLQAKYDQTVALDPEQGRKKAMAQFIDGKSFRPGLGNYDRGDAQ